MMRMRRRVRPSMAAPTSWLMVALLLCFVALVNGLGGELAAFPITPTLLGSRHSVRQNVCPRYELFHAGELDMRDALSGLSLRLLMSRGEFFHYTDDGGIPSENPGLLADIMDEIAHRANFTWRNSFGVLDPPEYYNANMTFTDMLVYGVNTFDAAINWWDQSVERMEKGVAFVEPWFDGSVILIDQKDPPEDKKSINLWNWLLPFEPAVWVLTGFTIILSALVFQLIEYLSGEREDRPIGQWFSDNLYLSAINFSQNYEYAPNSTAGRIFGVSMTLWALVITATYTANLASLLVDESKQPLIVDSIEHAVVLGIPICTYADTNSDVYIKNKYKKAIRVPRVNELETYKALRRGECGLVAGYKDNWLSFEGNEQYNPDCDLSWVGRPVKAIKSGFAVKADMAYQCTSLIREVLNLHLIELIAEGILEDLWKKHRENIQDFNCAERIAAAQGSLDFRRQLRASSHQALEPQELASGGSRTVNQRLLKGAGRGASTATITPGTHPSSLTVEHMTGSFLLHWLLMGFAVCVSVGGVVYEQWKKRQPNNDESDKEVVHVAYRRHGPTIGMSPRVNTSVVVRNYSTASVRSASTVNTYTNPRRSLEKRCSPRYLSPPLILDSFTNHDNHIDQSDSNNGLTMNDGSQVCGRVSTDPSRQEWKALHQKHQVLDEKIDGLDDRLSTVEENIEKILSLLQGMSDNHQQGERVL